MENERGLKAELANALSHGIGIILIIAFAPLLYVKAFNSGIPLLPFAVAFYIVGLLMVFTFSTLYHATQNKMAKALLHIFDHISIFLLIGGTYLPFVLVHADPKRAIWLMGIQWVVIFAGIINKIFFIGRFRLLSTFVYVGLGIMILAMGKHFWQSLPGISMYLLIGGGVAYIIGVFFYQIEKWQYNHFIWHLFVLTAAALHFAGIYLSF